MSGMSCFMRPTKRSLFRSRSWFISTTCGEVFLDNFNTSCRLAVETPAGVGRRDRPELFGVDVRRRVLARAAGRHAPVVALAASALAVAGCLDRAAAAEHSHRLDSHGWDAAAVLVPMFLRESLEWARGTELSRLAATRAALPPRSPRQAQPVLWFSQKNIS